MNPPVTPRLVLQQVASALPDDVRHDVIIVGSLAAGYQLLRDNGQVMRTKDVDCMLAPHARAMVSATRATDRLLAEGWQPQALADYHLPGTANTPDDRLAVVRLHPPDTEEWFLELLGAPASIAPTPSTAGNTSRRLETSGGHFTLPSFAYLGLTQFQPTLSEFGIRIATPEMMALANLLHHPVINDKRMSQLFASRQVKRSNKDLGRVLALAHLAALLDEDALDHWQPLWSQALADLAPANAEALLTRAPAGLHALRASPPDLEQALHTVNYGLLSAQPLSAGQFIIALDRLLQALGE